MTTPSKSPESAKPKTCWAVLAAVVLVAVLVLALDPCTSVTDEPPAPASSEP